MSSLIARVFVAFALTTAGCTHNQPLPQHGREHISGWSDEIRAEAELAFIYAQLSTNVYDDPREAFALPADVQRREFQSDDRYGFGYALYTRPTAAGTEKIVVFRGTDFTQGRDWVHGNIVAYQNELGLRTFKALRQRHDEPGPWTVTGHSLGGGIATYVSLLEPNVTSFVFNSSPRFRAPSVVQRNERHSIAEYGEVLKATRLLGREADQLYTSIGCTRGINVIRQHKMRLLAECLTQIAAYGSEEARQSLRANPSIAWPPGLSR